MTWLSRRHIYCITQHLYIYLLCYFVHYQKCFKIAHIAHKYTHSVKLFFVYFSHVWILYYHHFVVVTFFVVCVWWWRILWVHFLGVVTWVHFLLYVNDLCSIVSIFGRFLSILWFLMHFIMEITPKWLYGCVCQLHDWIQL